MKIAISAMEKELNSPVDPRFGRTKYFLVVDLENQGVEVHDNQQNFNSVQGAGIQAAKNVSVLDVAAVITGNVGPKAFSALAAAQIDVYLCETGTVNEAIEAFRSGQLKKCDQANREGHWS